jgi:hypothetical protein
LSRAWLPWTVLLVARVAGAEPLPAFLDGHGAERWPDRALRVRAGAVYLSASGPAVASAKPDDFWLPTELTVLAAGPRPRVLDERPALRVALYLAPASLAEVALAGAVLVPVGAAARPVSPTSPGVHLAAGVTLVRGAHGRFHLELAGWTIDGVVDAAHVGRVYRPAALSPATPFHGDALLRGAPALLDGPGGAIVARAPAADVPVERLGAAERGHIQVRWLVRRVEIIGWAPEASVVATRDPPAPVEPPEEQVAEGMGSTDPNLPAGTLLYDRPHGAVIGVTLQPLGQTYDEERPDGWWRSSFETRLGPVPLWVAPVARAR